MWRQFLVMTICLGCFRIANAVDQKFPYRAAVITDKVDVRCGPGSQFYVTSRLNKSDVVTVHRHDHGGWFMIAPPKGSVSWIDAKLVKKTNSTTGVVQVAPQDGRPARAIVRIGSSISKDHSYYGRELSNGDQVTILGEETLETARGPVRMLKIVPPAQEFRWMKGEFLVPQDETIRHQIAQDPYQIPAEHRSAFVNKKQAEAKLVEKQKQQELTRRQMLYDELDRIDRLYAGMMQKEPSEWDLPSIEKQYHQLSIGADSTIATLIQKRFDVLKRRTEILNHYQEFVQVSAESAKRDQELVAMQLGYQSPAEATAKTDHAAQQQPGQVANSSVAPRLNGAGLIQPLQSYPGAPQFALVAPDGRMLAYLETAEGVNITQWIGKPSGIIGNRQFNPQLGADVIRVQRVVPVQLVQ